MNSWWRFASLFKRLLQFSREKKRFPLFLCTEVKNSSGELQQRLVTCIPTPEDAKQFNVIWKKKKHACNIKSCMCYHFGPLVFICIDLPSPLCCSEPWGFPSPTTHSKTASWPWQRASWGCQSTPVCWSTPSWSGDSGESLDPSHVSLVKESKGGKERVRQAETKQQREGRRVARKSSGNWVLFLMVAITGGLCCLSKDTLRSHYKMIM